MQEIINRVISDFNKRISTKIKAEQKTVDPVYKFGFHSGAEAFKEARLIIKQIAQEYNMGWIPVAERLPEKVEYAASTADGEYFRRLEIAVQTDTTEYFIGYFDGGKWFDKRYRSFEGDVVAWKVHQSYQPGQETRESFKEER